MTHHYTLRELSDLGVSSLTFNYRSLAADSASLRCPMGTSPVAALPWAEGDRIVISDDRLPGTPRLFSGCVRRKSSSFSASSWSTQVELTNDVDILERTTFAYVDDEGKVCYAQSFYTPRAEGESAEGERITSSRSVCERCFDWAAAGGALSCTRDVQFDATTLGVAGTGSQSCWSLITTAMRWVPDAVTAMRYDDSGDRLQFLTARNLDTCCIDLHTGAVTNAAGEVLCHFINIATCDLTPRPDLVPPVCALTGRKHLVLPENGNVREPGAFIYHVREDGGGGLNAVQAGKQARQTANKVIRAQAPRQLVRGAAAPLNLANAIGEVDMKEESNLAPETQKQWLQSFAAFSLLKKFSAAQLSFGKPLFEPVPAADAYPPEGDDDSGSVPGATPLDPDAAANTAPANYEDNPSSWGKLYLFKEGAFPASVKASRNISGLKWCRGRLSQLVWLAPGAGLPEGVSEEKVSEFFAGSFPVVVGNKRPMTRYALLSIEGIWINRRNLRYKEGSNVEDGYDEPDSGTDNTPDDTPDGGAAADPDYEAALRDFYASTRKLYHDGSLTLSGLKGTPGALLGTAINIKGLLPEWEEMQTPCNAVTYDPAEGIATLELGSRETLSVDELLERQELGRLQAAARAAGDTENPQDRQPDSTPDAGEEDDEAEEVEMIAPTINASLSTNVSGKLLNPFEIYKEKGKYYMNGGTLITPDGAISVEPIDITEHYASGRRFYVRPGKTAGSYVVRYTNTTP